MLLSLSLYDCLFILCARARVRACVRASVRVYRRQQRLAMGTRCRWCVTIWIGLTTASTFHCFSRRTAAQVRYIWNQCTRVYIHILNFAYMLNGGPGTQGYVNEDLPEVFEGVRNPDAVPGALPLSFSLRPLSLSLSLSAPSVSVCLCR